MSPTTGSIWLARTGPRGRGATSHRALGRARAATRGSGVWRIGPSSVHPPRSHFFPCRDQLPPVTLFYSPARPEATDQRKDGGSVVRGNIQPHVARYMYTNSLSDSERGYGLILLQPANTRSIRNIQPFRENQILPALTYYLKCQGSKFGIQNKSNHTPIKVKKLGISFIHAYFVLRKHATARQTDLE